MSKQENENLDDSADNFGLPDIEFKPIDRTEEIAPATSVEQPESSTPELEETTTDSEEVVAKEEVDKTPYLPDDFEESQTTPPIVVGLIIALLLAGVVSLTYFFIYKPKADKAKQEQLEKEKLVELKNKAKQDSLLKVREEELKQQESLKEQKAKPAEGTIEQLTERTQKFYVVISSSIDGDLVMDYAKKLSAKGVSTKIIAPFGKAKYYRLTLAQEDTFAKAQAVADASKSEYGNSLWVLKY